MKTLIDKGFTVGKCNMWLIHGVKGVSKLLLILLLLIDFVLGALLSYIATMGYYAPLEFHLPSRANVTIEKVEFYAENATFFNVTILNPSYSPSTVAIDEIMVSTDDGLLHEITDTFPSIRVLAPGRSQTYKAYWNWGNYTGQTVNVFALVADGSGATFQKITPFMNLTVASVDFDPTISAANFTVTVQSLGSQTFMNITRITLNGEEVTVSPLLPYGLDVNASATLTLTRAWSDLQGKNATVSVETLQGFTAQKSQVVPEVLKIPSIVFNALNTSSFNLTVQNVATPQTSLDISQVKVEVQGETVTIENVAPALPYPLQPASEVLLVCSWNWGGYQGQGAKATVTVYTQQGFSVSTEASIP